MLHLELYGKPNSRYEFLRHVLLRKLDDRQIDVSITEIHDVQRFIEQNIRAIPAIRVNDAQIHECPDGSDINEFTEKVVKDIIAYEEKDRGVILVPIDFAHQHLDAIEMAAQLAAKRNFKIRLLHIARPRPVEISGTVWVDTQAHGKFCEGLEDIAKPYRERFPQLKIEHEVLDGFAADVILRESKKVNIKYIVMRRSGDDRLIKKWIGGVSKKVAREASCPVFLIPPNFKGQIKNILFATSNLDDDQNGLKMIRRISEVFDANVHVLHVHNAAVPMSSGFDGTPEVMREIGTGYQWSEIQNEDVTEGILEASTSLHSELLVMANKKKDFWERLVQKSVTKDLIQKLEQQALLIIHL